MKNTLPRLSILLGLAFWLVAVLLIWSKPAQAAPAESGFCGDQGLACSDNQRCCEHEVAIFGEGGAASPAYKEGKCIPKEQRCADFWCGNRHCQGGLFGTPGVCCVSQVSESQTGYRCAYSDLNCPGNTQQLHIRQDQVASSNIQN